MSNRNTAKLLAVSSATAALVLVGTWFLLQGPKHPDSRMSGTMMGGIAVPFSTLDKSAMGAWRCPAAALFRSAAEWNEHATSQGSDCLALTPPVPAVRWEDSMVLLVALGEKNSSGYGVEVRGVSDEGDAITVDVEVTEPVAGEATQQTITAPFHLVVVDRRETPDLRINYVAASSTPVQETSWGKLKGKFTSR